MQVRRGACPALLGQVSTARTCGRDRQWSRSHEWSRSDRAGTAKMGETWEGRRRDGEKRHMCKYLFTDNLSHAWRWHAWRCANVTVHAPCAENVRATNECMYTSRRTHCSRYYMCTNEQKNCQKKNQHSSLHDHLDKTKFFNSSSGFGECMYRTPLKFSDFIISCPSWSFLLVFVPSVGFSSIIVSGGFSVYQGMRLWETDLPKLLIFDDAFVWTFSNCARSI